MPYLEHLYCEECGPPFNLDLDEMATIAAYQADGRTYAYINSATMIWDYLVYSCAKCRQSWKLTYREVEERVRRHLSSLATKYALYMEELVKAQNTEEARKSGEFFKTRDAEIKRRIDEVYGGR